MTEKEILELIKSRTSLPGKKYHRLEQTLRPGKRKPKKRKIKRVC